ncbi:snRNA-activating protein complex subunit 3 [Pieris rapae]|uniref:snRNA-activating protein complex subunit 3 n=1 Tax=Pieris rapae TaxID=64459 RepID=UPI001E27F367|nr:snRNA-activating protein complex subunit 3 [Pieris rapae]
MLHDDKLEGTLQKPEVSIHHDLNKGLKPDFCENEANIRNLYAKDDGPHWRNVTSTCTSVTKSLITKNLPKIFQHLPIRTQSTSREDVEIELEQQIVSFVGNIDDEEYDKLVEFCDPKHLETGHELKMSMSLPTSKAFAMNSCYNPQASSSLNFCKNLMFRKKKIDRKNRYSRKLKYRTVCLIPPPEEKDEPDNELLQPGKDLVYRVRLYRPFPYSYAKITVRHSLLMSEIVVLGQQPLWALRDHIYCLNDISTGIDVSENPDAVPSTSAKELFPSSFMFINNVFYVDERKGCSDITRELREWAAARNMGTFPSHSMDVKLEDIKLRLGHPDVYVHLGDCEHPFTISEVRLLHPRDPLRPQMYPFVSQVGATQVIYCSICSEHSTKWVVKDCDVVPFDPTYFCDTCFRLYLYKDGKKVCPFKAYVYKGNEMSILKPRH